MAVRIKLPGGTLKMKVYRELRERERTRRIPVLKVGSVYFTWWSNRQPQDESLSRIAGARTRAPRAGHEGRFAVFCLVVEQPASRQVARQPSLVFAVFAPFACAGYGVSFGRVSPASRGRNSRLTGSLGTNLSTVDDMLPALARCLRPCRAKRITA
ncbi:hypothetical protein CIT31_11980 [Mesorhizobium wenxiniae]|uniref:Uncharacterized protein n=1 Tax=Mesorhizobium wenxiniae TaxID=2014805 RepID=A0A271KGG0_9HYPH|nr:hypothetical protein CIT31_11980 [Mesorhizobium wenxiniae]